MAYYYLHFSEVISNLTPQESEWLRKVVSVPDENHKRTMRELERLGLRPAALKWTSSWPGFAADFRENNTRLWIHCSQEWYDDVRIEQWCDISHVGEMIRAFLEKFHPNKFFVLTWAETCFKPRRGEFSGGCLFATAKAWKTREVREIANEYILELNTLQSDFERIA